MNFDELLKVGAEVFQKSNLSGKAGSNLDISSIITALNGLTEGKGFDIGALLKNLDGNGFGEITKTWLGDGANDAISPEEIGKILGPDKVGEFASKLGLSEQEATGGLSEALPQIIDKGSSGGTLLDSLGGIEGMLGLAGKLFK